jgi:protein TonB
VPALAVHALIALVLLRGLAVAGSEAEEDPPRLFDLSATTPEASPPPPPPPPPDPGETESERRADPRPEGAASPPNIESRRTEIVSPVIRERRDQPNAATVAGAGSDPTQGSAPERGPGSGSGGIGTGTGSGDGGSGAGGGGGGGHGEGRLRRPRRIAGRLSDRDYPPGLGEAGVQGPVWVRYVVEMDGRVSNCTVTESSGSAILDRHTCALIEQRYRYRPARDGAGRPIRSSLVEFYEWVIQDLPEQHEPPRRRRRLF